MDAALVPPGEAVRRRMQAQARKDTKAEIQLRQALHSRGRRYRVSFPVPSLRRRTIDIAFTRLRVAVFIDGCFWHGCPVHYVPPKSNATWWEQKILGNRVRDRDTTDQLKQLGWTVIRLWEHESVDDMVRKVEEALQCSEC